MKYRYSSNDGPAGFRVLTRPSLGCTDRPDFGTMVSYEAQPVAGTSPAMFTLEISAAGHELTCEFRPAAEAAEDFTCRVHLPAKLVGTDAVPALAVFLNHVLAPVCVGVFGDTTYVDWSDVEGWLRANPNLLLRCGTGDTIAEAYVSARESFAGHLDAHPEAEVFLVGLCPAGTFFLDAFRCIRAAWGDRIVLTGFPAVDTGLPAVSLLVADAGNFPY